MSSPRERERERERARDGWMDGWLAGGREGRTDGRRWMDVVAVDASLVRVEKHEESLFHGSRPVVSI